ncbi:MAG: Mur ligase family protein [Aggregatilineales bacterium]
MSALIVLLIWLAGTCLRIYRQAHYFQLEEYMNARYLRWVAARRERWLPGRPLTAWLIGTVALFALAEAPGSPLPLVLGAASGAIAGWPPRRTEVKKPFRATARAKRLLAAAWAMAAAAAAAALLATTRLPDRLQIAAAAACGVLLLLAAPLLLAAANLLLAPVEAHSRRRFEQRARRVLQAVRPVVIGVTGSYGKTSTKAYLAHILNGRFKAYPTPKSYNTLMGVCLAINNDLANDSVDYFIAEMGAYTPGEIARICKLTRPTISIVVEVGPQHLERFGSLENIAIAKYEIIKALPPNGVGIFNWDNPFVREMYQRGHPQTRIAVSCEADPADVAPDGPRFVASKIEEHAAGLAFTVTDTHTMAQEQFNAPLLGLHNVTNILLATAVAVHEGMTLREVAWRVTSLQPAEARLMRQTTPEGITILNDAYSANPVGAKNALRALALVGEHSRRRLLVTPGMVELGPLMAQENQRLGQIAAEHATDVILIGPEQTAPIRDGLLSAGFAQDRVHTVRALSDAVKWYKDNLRAGDTVLFLNDLPDTYST